MTQTEQGGRSRRKDAVITFELIKLFILTARLKSIAGAARELSMAPSLATRKIAQLERALGVRLFERTTRSMKLTEAGATALDWAMKTDDSYIEVADKLTAIAVSPSGTIRLAVAQYAATAYLPSILAQFHAKYPNIKLAITTTDKQVDLIDGQYDVAIHSGNIPHSSIIGKRVREFDRILCATPQYIAVHGTPKSPIELSDHNCLIHAGSEQKSWCFLREKELLTQSVTPFIVSDNYAFLVQLVLQSLGILRVARSLVASDIQAGNLLEILPDYQCVYSTGDHPGLWVLYPNRHVLNRTRLLIDFLINRL